MKEIESRLTQSEATVRNKEAELRAQAAELREVEKWLGSALHLDAMILH